MRLTIMTTIFTFIRKEIIPDYCIFSFIINDDALALFKVGLFSLLAPKTIKQRSINNSKQIIGSLRWQFLQKKKKKKKRK